MRRAGRRDSNHSEIVDELRRHGCCVVDLANLGQGVPDLLVAVQGHNMAASAVHLVEIKSLDTAYGRDGANVQQIEFARKWPAPIYLLHSIKDACNIATGRVSELTTINFGGQEIENTARVRRGGRKAAVLPDGGTVESVARKSAPGPHGGGRPAR